MLSFEQIVRGLVEGYGVPREKAEAAASRIAVISSVPTNRPARREKKVDIQATAFRIWCRENDLPLPTAEYKFSRRMYRFDFAWPNVDTGGGVAIEVQGGIWRRGGGAHTGKGHLRDMEKLNLAQALGWRVLQRTPQNLFTTDTLELLRPLLK